MCNKYDIIRIEAEIIATTPAKTFYRRGISTISYNIVPNYNNNKNVIFTGFLYASGTYFY